MKRLTFISILMIAVVVLSACAPATPVTGLPTADLETESPLSTATPGTGAGTGTSSAGGTETGTAAAPAGTGTPQAGTTGTPVIPVTGANCEEVTVQLSEPVAGGTGGTGAASTPSAAGTGTPTASTGGTTATGTPGTDTTETPDPFATPVVDEPYLVDCEGMALYMFVGDTQNSETSACTEDCLSVWFPLTVEEGQEPMAGEGIDESLLATITREDDGTLQVTYNGWPLYSFNGDIKPGNTYGSGVNDQYFLISAAGEPIQ